MNNNTFKILIGVLILVILVIILVAVVVNSNNDGNNGGDFNSFNNNDEDFSGSEMMSHVKEVSAMETGDHTSTNFSDKNNKPPGFRKHKK